LRAACGAE
jgi:hypothetical protein